MKTLILYNHLEENIKYRIHEGEDIRHFNYHNEGENSELDKLLFDPDSMLLHEEFKEIEGGPFPPHDAVIEITAGL